MLKFEIAPPEWNKPIRRSGIYKHVWRRARGVLKTSKTIALLGYSLPNTDLPAHALLMVDATGGAESAPQFRLVVIANPDVEARARIRRVLNKRIDGSTRILTFDSLKDFALFLQV